MIAILVITNIAIVTLMIFITLAVKHIVAILSTIAYPGLVDRKS